VRPPSPESNTPIGRSLIGRSLIGIRGAAQAVGHRRAQTGGIGQHRDHPVETAGVGVAQHAIEIVRILVAVTRETEHDHLVVVGGGADDAQALVPRERGIDQIGQRVQVGELDRRPRRVVRLERSRCAHLAGIEERDRATEQLLHPFARRAPEAQDRRFGSRAVDDGRLHAHPAWSPIEDHVDIVTEVGEHVGCGGGTHVPEPVG